MTPDDVMRDLMRRFVEMLLAARRGPDAAPSPGPAQLEIAVA